jgi:L-ascorbate metabolism protein UlaG (beta-lactamase superfamily)
MTFTITYVGHATVLLDVDGVRILTDPLLRNRVFYLQRRSTPVAASVYQGIDAVLLSHLHLDHLDIPSLRMLDKKVQLIIPAGAGELLSRNGFSNIQETHAGEINYLGLLSIKAVYANHHSIYPPFGPSTESLGYLIKGSKNVYFPGDTDLFPEMVELAYGLDVALLPVWGWGPNLGPGHMNPLRAAEALTLLHPRIAIPIHWGTFYPKWLGWFRASLMVDPPQLFLEIASKRVPEVDVHILRPGSSFSIP